MSMFGLSIRLTAEELIMRFLRACGNREHSPHWKRRPSSVAKLRYARAAAISSTGRTDSGALPRRNVFVW
jgi:hypothetical protein